MCPVIKALVGGLNVKAGDAWTVDNLYPSLHRHPRPLNRIPHL